MDTRDPSGEAQFYLYAMDKDEKDLTPDTVFHKVANEDLAKTLCSMLSKDDQGEGNIRCFQYQASAEMISEEQALLDQTLEQLGAYITPQSVGSRDNCPVACSLRRGGAHLGQ